MDRSESLASTTGGSHAEPVVGEDPIERFEIIEQLGRGSYGCVYKAQDRTSGQIVALKTIPVMDSDDLSVIQKEIELLQDCDHPNIVSYLGSWRTSDCLWIAMEYCGGGSVSDVMQTTGEPLEEDVISYICGESLKGLAYLHHMGKLHRDIKCGNILLTEQGHVKLADFGVAAQLTNTMSKRNTFIGTPHWMAPEVIQESRYDGKVDVWALGITGIEMAEVTPPRWTVHPMRVIFMISREPPPSLSTFDKWSLTFHDFVAQCLQKDPKSRPTTKHLLQHKFILRCPPTVQTNSVVPLINTARQLSATRKIMEGGNTLLAEQGLRAVKKLSPAKGPWARTTAGWGRLAGLTFGVKDMRQSGSSDSASLAPGDAAATEVVHSTGTMVASQAAGVGGTTRVTFDGDGSGTLVQHSTGTLVQHSTGTLVQHSTGTLVHGSGTLLQHSTGTVDARIDYSGTVQVNSEYGGTVAVHRSRDESDPDYAAALRAANHRTADDGYAAAVREASDRHSLKSVKRNGIGGATMPSVTAPQQNKQDSREAQTTLLVERLRSLYMSENVIPLPFLKASSAVSLVLKPYSSPSHNTHSVDAFSDDCFNVLVDVAMDSYSGAPSSRPDRNNALPQSALEQVRGSPLLMSLINTLAHQKRKLEEEVLTPAAVERVQSDINDISDTLRTILCL